MPSPDSCCSADVFGGGRVLATGYALATMSALVAAAAPTGGVLIGARITQGVGAALTVPAALAIIAAARQDLAGRSRALASYAGSGAVGFGLGLAVGGLAADTIGWRWLFAALAAISALLTGLTVGWVQRRARSAGRVSVWGGVLSSAGLLLLAYTVTIGAKQGFYGATVLCGVAGTGLIVAFVRTQVRSQSPIMPIGIWSRPGFALTIVSTMLLYGGWVSAYYFVALLLQGVLGLSAAAAALAMLPLALGAAIGSRTAGWLLPRVDQPRTVVFVGSLTCALAVAGLAIPAVDQVAIVVPVLLVVVTGQSAAFVAQNVTALSATDLDEAGLSGALFNAGCQVGSGMTVGSLAVLSDAVSGGSRPVEAAAGYRAALLAAALLALVAGMIVYLPRRSGLPKAA
ncbi:hypothetical protein DLE60_07665 [Micromonospora globispora]|uniref:MFS transporter n=1 Tax=Micromonospora globispora TaxID=1450148 RepID=UPI000D6FE3D7|nr:MFS transporter [Micromonospora globispora]PWU61082.1 hypothetical protein DLE60_07665 [Micromonospora globispora]